MVGSFERIVISEWYKVSTLYTTHWFIVARNPWLIVVGTPWLIVDGIPRLIIDGVPWLIVDEIL